jgi:hypothetical protein
MEAILNFTDTDNGFTYEAFGETYEVDVVAFTEWMDKTVGNDSWRRPD